MLTWLGDSQAALVRDVDMVQLRDPHKTERDICMRECSL